MGVDYSASAVIGVKLNVMALFTKENGLGCSHRKNGNYCRECGSKFTDDIYVPHDGWAYVESDHDEIWSNPSEYLFKGYEVCTGNDFDCYDQELMEAREIFICISTAHCLSERKPEISTGKVTSIDTEVIKMKQSLSEAGIWDIGKFGLWSILNVS